MSSTRVMTLQRWPNGSMMEANRSPVTKDGFADDRPCRDRAVCHRIGIGAVERDRSGGICVPVGRGKLVGVLRIAQLQTPVAEVQFGVRDGAVRAVHPAHQRGAEHRYIEVDGGRRAVETSVFDLHRWAPSPDTARFVEHFWSVSWDRRKDGPFESTVITFPAMHITREWGDDVARHGCSLPNTLLHGVVPKVFRTTISARGTVVGARFHPGGYTARFGRDASVMTGQVVPVDDELFGAPVLLDDDVAAAGAGLDAGRLRQQVRRLTLLTTTPLRRVVVDSCRRARLGVGVVVRC
jgi:hypothetical protein